MREHKATALIQDKAYELKFENGIPFHIRTTNLLRDQPVTKKDAQG